MDKTPTINLAKKQSVLQSIQELTPCLSGINLLPPSVEKSALKKLPFEPMDLSLFDPGLKNHSAKKVLSSGPKRKLPFEPMDLSEFMMEKTTPASVRKKAESAVRRVLPFEPMGQEEYNKLLKELKPPEVQISAQKSDSKPLNSGRKAVRKSFCTRPKIGRPSLRPSISRFQAKENLTPKQTQKRCSTSRFLTKPVVNQQKTVKTPQQRHKSPKNGASSGSPMDNFLKLEQECGVCPPTMTIEEKIAKIMERDEQQFQLYQKQHAANMLEIKELLKGKQPLKEIQNNKNPSSVLLKNVNSNDLRKNMFKKNLKEQFEGTELQNNQKGIDLYYEMKADFAVLATPKPIKSDSKTKSLSEKIQEQCFLLQADTPKPK